MATQRPRPQALQIWAQLGQSPYLLLVALAAFAQFISVELWVESSRAQLLWLPGAVLMCALLALPWRHWPLAVAAIGLGALCVLLALSAPWPALLVGLIGQLLLVVPVGYVLVRTRDATRGETLASYRWLGVFLLLAIIVLPILGATWAEWISNRLDASGHPGGWLNLALSHSASYVLVVPAFLGLRENGTRQTGTPWRSYNLALITAMATAFAIACWVPFHHAPLLRPLLLLLAFTLLVWSLLLFGAAGAFTALLTLSLICMQASNVGLLPLQDQDGYAGVLSIQIWAIGMALALLSLSAVAEQRAGLRLSLTQAYARLSDLTGRMLLVQEEERARIARDLHDDINQSVAAISIQISALKKDLESAPRARLAEIQEQLLSVSDDIRRLSHDLHPSILRFTSLAASLIALCESHSAPSGLRVDCAIHEDMALSNEQKLNLFRIAQEAIHNVESHARARSVQLSLSRDGEDVVLRVDDDGIGIPEDLRRRLGGGLGMISMEERARSLGGTFQMMRLLGGGSRLEVRLPIRGSLVTPRHSTDLPSTVALDQDP
ncbi:MAG TPA: histidine kinase [Pseudoxanthomonas sp.]|nr:histidine kinase [Pseudoxanthomonas sp.]